MSDRVQISRFFDYLLIYLQYYIGLRWVNKTSNDISDIRLLVTEAGSSLVIETENLLFHCIGELGGMQV